jgi:hypothetical protein
MRRSKIVFLVLATLFGLISCAPSSTMPWLSRKPATKPSQHFEATRLRLNGGSETGRSFEYVSPQEAAAIQSDVLKMWHISQQESLRENESLSRVEEIPTENTPKDPPLPASPQKADGSEGGRVEDIGNEHAIESKSSELCVSHGSETRASDNIIPSPCEPSETEKIALPESCEKRDEKNETAQSMSTDVPTKENDGNQPLTEATQIPDISNTEHLAAAMTELQIAQQEQQEALLHENQPPQHLNTGPTVPSSVPEPQVDYTSHVEPGQEAVRAETLPEAENDGHSERQLEQDPQTMHERGEQLQDEATQSHPTAEQGSSEPARSPLAAPDFLADDTAPPAFQGGQEQGARITSLADDEALARAEAAGEVEVTASAPAVNLGELRRQLKEVLRLRLWGGPQIYV